MSKIISFLEAVGAILIVAALALWSGEYWKTSNILWWAGLACVTPAIAWKAWPQSFWRQAFIGLVFCILVFIGHWWFGKKEIKAKIPFLPEITIHR
jgi:hypothetical protein